MALTSGIGSLAGYNTGGSVPQVGGSGGTSAPMTLEEFLEAFGRSGNGLIGGLTGDVAYKAYLQALAASGGNVDVTNGNITVKPRTLPSYMSVNDDGKILFAEGTTNRQFIEAMNLLGLLGTKRPDGQTDYQWLLAWLGDSPESGSETWLAHFYGRPDEAPDRGFLSNTGEGALNSENKATMTRLLDLLDNASVAGGFTPNQSFINTYLPPVVPGQSFTGESVTRPVFIGQPPTGGEAEAPYYQASDVLVSSAEQPSLYDYNVDPETGLGQFDPYAPFERKDPYTGKVDLLYPYKPPPEVTILPVPPEEPVTPIEPFAPPSTPVSTAPTTTSLTPTVPEATTPISTTPTTTPVTPTVPEATTPVSTAPTTTSLTPTVPEATTPSGIVQGPPPGPTETTDTVQAMLDYRPAMGEYARAPNYKDIDPLLHSRRRQISDLREFLRGSRQDVSTEDFLSALQQAQGRYGQGMTYDPARGLFSNISEAELARHREAQSVPFGINPDQMTDVEQIRAKMMGNRKLRGQQEVTIGDRMYFLDDGNVVSYQFRMPEMGYTPTFNQGGIVSVADQNADRVSGEGIESMLMTYKSPDVVSRERSAATLRRNLAKVAPRPTAQGPVPTMQQGIMPMAR